MVLVFGSMTKWANAEEPYWKFLRELIPPAQVNTNGQYAKLILPMEVLGRSQPGLADLRILDAEGKEVPFVNFKSILQDKQALKTKFFNIGRFPDGTRVVTVDTGPEKIMHSSADLKLNGYEFIATVKVEGSDDQKTWVQLTIGAILDKPYRYTTVNYPQVNYRYLRLTLAHKVGNTGEVEGVTIYPAETVMTKRPLFSKETIAFTEKPTLSKNKDAMVWKMATPYPVNVAAITFDIASDYFERRVEVKVSDDGKQWFTAGAGFIFRYPDGVETQQMQLLVEKARYWQVWLYHADDKPLVVRKVEMHGPFEEIIFPSTGQKMHLLYGNAKAETSKYDLANIISHNPVALKSVQEWQLGKVKLLNVPLPAPKGKPWTENNEYLLNISLILMVVVLGFFLKRAYKKT